MSVEGCNGEKKNERTHVSKGRARQRPTSVSLTNDMGQMVPSENREKSELNLTTSNAQGDTYQCPTTHSGHLPSSPPSPFFCSEISDQSLTFCRTVYCPTTAQERGEGGNGGSQVAADYCNVELEVDQVAVWWWSLDILKLLVRKRKAAVRCDGGGSEDDQHIATSRFKASGT